MSMQTRFWLPPATSVADGALVVDLTVNEDRAAAPVAAVAPAATELAVVGELPVSAPLAQEEWTEAPTEERAALLWELQMVEREYDGLGWVEGDGDGWRRGSDRENTR